MSARRERNDLSKKSKKHIARHDLDKSAVRGDEHILPPELQQSALNTFSTAFVLGQDVVDLKAVVQRVKGHLYDRDFVAAFSQPAYLRAYAIRWSAARSLGYAHILTNPVRSCLFVDRDVRFASYGRPSVAGETNTVGERSEIIEATSRKLNVVCIGGGAGAEIIAFAAAYRALGLGKPMSVHAIDLADWSESFEQLRSALTVPPELSKYQSEATKSRLGYQNLLQDTSHIELTFQQQDILNYDVAAANDLFRSAAICTIMFTLNELFSTSLPKTTSFLLNLTTMMPSHSHLLVIDSPGSYSEIQLGKKQTEASSTPASTNTKKYPMKWLLDHTLLEVAKDGDQATWEKIEDEDSLWFRIEQKDQLRYPIELENMRYQLHLYRKV